jgi:hypothetical protein
MPKATIAFLIAWTLAACHQRVADGKQEYSCDCLFYQGAITDTEFLSLKDFSYRTIETELLLGAYLPGSERMMGSPDTHIAEVAEVANFSKAQHEEMLTATNGHIYLDTTDRNFEKYWYDKAGLLYKYEIRSFGDMRHNQVCFSYYPNHTIEWMSINDVITDSLKYKVKTIKFNSNGQVIVLTHYIPATRL